MLEDIVLKIRDAGGDAYIFGGYVRDTFFTKFPNKDIDVEVYGLDVNSLQDILLQFGHIDVVGKSFAVIKLRTSDGVDYDFSLPRRERKTGEGHKSFEIESDPFMTMEEASSRRDFTMNAIGFNPLTKEFVDPYGGISDIENKILRATSARFSEDPLRVLRGMQFAGRFGMTMDGYTKKNCQYLVYEYKTLSKERIATEFIKLAEKSTVPSLGFKVLEETFWIHCFEVLNLAKILKPDIYARNLQYLDAFVKFYDFSGDKRIIMFFAILLKDLTNDAKCLNQFGIEDKYIISSVGKLIANYDFHISYDESVYLLAEALSPESIEDLCLLYSFGEFKYAMTLLLKTAKVLGVEKKTLDKIVTGEMLLSHGFSSGKLMGQMIKDAYCDQMKGVIFDNVSASSWITSRKEKSPN